MSFPFRANLRLDTFSRLVEFFRSVVERFPDKRTGDITYAMADAALGAFSVFFTQSPSFLDFQCTLQVAKGCNNALSHLPSADISPLLKDHPDVKGATVPGMSKGAPGWRRRSRSTIRC